MSNNVTRYLVFSPDSKFMEDGNNHSSVNQYNQTRNHPAAINNEAVKKNLKAQETALIPKIIEKNPAGVYKHFDVIVENFFYLQEVAKKGSDKRLQAEVKKVRQLIIKKQKELFASIHANTFTERSLANLPTCLLKFPALYNKKSEVEKYDSAVHVAARAGNRVAVRTLKSRGCFIDRYKPNFDAENDQKAEAVNCTPLGIAILRDDVKMAKLLLDKGAKLRRFIKVHEADGEPKSYRDGLNIAAFANSKQMAVIMTNYLKEKRKTNPEIVDEFFAPDAPTSFLYHTMLEMLDNESQRTNRVENQARELKRELEETNERVARLEALVHQLANQPEEERPLKKVRSTTGDDE